MTKQAEIDYFGRMDDNARRYAGGKPFTSDRRGAYLLDMGQTLKNSVFTGTNGVVPARKTSHRPVSDSG